jgi:hypothetical protein
MTISHQTRTKNPSILKFGDKKFALRKSISCDIVNEFQIELFECGWVQNINTPTTHEFEGVPRHQKIVFIIAFDSWLITLMN